MTDLDSAVLDDPVGQALRGPQAHLAQRRGRTATYLPEVATFAAVPSGPTASDWADLAQLVGAGGLADLFTSTATPPEDWAPVFSLAGLQLVAGPDVRAGEDGPGIVELGEDDVPDMLALVELTRPGPFWRRTITLGTYLGIRQDGVLVAMAGERLRPPGWAEISAVCTAPQARGRGHGSALVRAVARRISARGDHPFLHVLASNTPAIELYEQLGFTRRRAVRFRGFRTPDAPAAPSNGRARSAAPAR
jgi:ribosomal protein S18 acetylase RimI-like enzyme